MSNLIKKGDRGTTDLARNKNISKSDDRIALVGSLEELVSYLGVLKTRPLKDNPREFLTEIQKNLRQICTGVSDPFSKDGKLDSRQTDILDEEIDRLSALFTLPKEEDILPGSDAISAEIDLVRSVARRAERALSLVSVRYGADSQSKRYMNHLGQYLYVLARYQESDAIETSEKSKSDPNHAHRSDEGLLEAVVEEVKRQMGISQGMTLDRAKKLIEKIEEEAVRRGKQAVIAICNPQGNPIAVHVMDGAYLVSFDVAVKKAYTAVAVKMSTMELGRLAAPGGTFYGLDKMEGGNIIIFGGGVPLYEGGTLIGGLGISGGTGEEDHSLAEYALSIL